MRGSGLASIDPCQPKTMPRTSRQWHRGREAQGGPSCVWPSALIHAAQRRLCPAAPNLRSHLAFPKQSPSAQAASVDLFLSGAVNLATIRPPPLAPAAALREEAAAAALSACPKAADAATDLREPAATPHCLAAAFAARGMILEYMSVSVLRARVRRLPYQVTVTGVAVAQARTCTTAPPRRCGGIQFPSTPPKKQNTILLGGGGARVPRDVSDVQILAALKARSASCCCGHRNGLWISGCIISLGW